MTTHRRSSFEAYPNFPILSSALEADAARILQLTSTPTKCAPYSSSRLRQNVKDGIRVLAFASPPGRNARFVPFVRERDGMNHIIRTVLCVFSDLM